MANVQFDESQTFSSREILGAKIVPGMITFLIKRGLAKDPKQAHTLLIIAISICLLGAICIPFAHTLAPKSQAEKLKTSKPLQEYIAHGQSQ